MDENALEKVQFRQAILTAQKDMQDMIKRGELRDTSGECLLTHRFSPIDPKYGACVYAREIFLPKNSFIIGKIHKFSHLNFILKGKVIVRTEFGETYYEAPCTFISEAGVKRGVFALEDTTWTTIHLTQYNDEKDLDKIEDEVIAKSYSELGLVSEPKELLEK